MEVTVFKDRVIIRNNLTNNVQVNQIKDDDEVHESRVPKTLTSIKECYENFRKVTQQILSAQEKFEEKYFKNEENTSAVQNARHELWQMIVDTKQALLVSEVSLMNSFRTPDLLPTLVTPEQQKPEKVTSEVSPCESASNADENAMETDELSSQKHELEALSQEKMFNMEIIQVETLNDARLMDAISSTPSTNDDEASFTTGDESFSSSLITNMGRRSEYDESSDDDSDMSEEAEIDQISHAPPEDKSLMNPSDANGPDITATPSPSLNSRPDQNGDLEDSIMESGSSKIDQDSHDVHKEEGLIYPNNVNAPAVSLIISSLDEENDKMTSQSKENESFEDGETMSYSNEINKIEDSHAVQGEEGLDLQLLMCFNNVNAPAVLLITSSLDEENDKMTSQSKENESFEDGEMMSYSNEIDKIEDVHEEEKLNLQLLTCQHNVDEPVIPSIPCLPDDRTISDGITSEMTDSDVEAKRSTNLNVTSSSPDKKNQVVESPHKMVDSDRDVPENERLKDLENDAMTDSNISKYYVEAESCYRSANQNNINVTSSLPEEKSQEMMKSPNKIIDSDGDLPEDERSMNVNDTNGSANVATLAAPVENQLSEGVLVTDLRDDGIVSAISGFSEMTDSDLDMLEAERLMDLSVSNVNEPNTVRMVSSIHRDKHVEDSSSPNKIIDSDGDLPEEERSTNVNDMNGLASVATLAAPVENQLSEGVLVTDLRDDGIMSTVSGFSEMTDSDLDILEAERLMDLSVSNVNEPNTVRMVSSIDRDKRAEDSSSDEEITSSYGQKTPTRTAVDVSMNHAYNRTPSSSSNVKKNKRKKTSPDTSDEDERMIEKARKTYDENPIHRIRKKLLKDDAVCLDLEEVSARKRRRSLSASADESAACSSSDESCGPARKTVKKRRITNFVSDEAVVTPGKGRKNIREIISDDKLGKETRKTGEEEEARKKRVAERKVLLDGMDVPGCNQKLVLDYDTRRKRDLIVVHPKIVEKLKPHQALGISFMFDACYESVERAAKGSGGGCILAHCMGLGKTFQTIALIHTVLTSEKIKTKTVLVLCPLTTVPNWITEFEKWLADVENKVQVFDIERYKTPAQRADFFRHWQTKGGVMILSYPMFRTLVALVSGKGRKQNVSKKYVEQIKSALLDPGPDLVVCDEGHLLKNENTELSIATMNIRTRRRIVLTGTPMQNNLNEYYCMIQFVKPNLLGTKEQFQNRFVNPITNGQYKDSNLRDVELMKERSHVLNRVTSGIIQRFNFDVIEPYLEPKHEYAISIGLSDTQANLYKYYLDHKTGVTDSGKSTGLLGDYNTLLLLWSHPLALKLSAEKKAQAEAKKKKGKAQFVQPPRNVENQWWRPLISDTALEDASSGPKLFLLLALLRHCERVNDKLLVFSLSLPTLDMIEHFLQQRKFGAWKKGVDYYRLDGEVPNDKRAQYMNAFNNPENKRLRLFLISKVGGLGVNLTGANRVVLFNVAWNPSCDSQSVFRVYRLGQKKPCYIYRFISQGIMEEQIYKRQVTKLSVSCRVVDEQQIERHYYQHNIKELYCFDRKFPTGEVFKLPNDHVLAELLRQYQNIILSYHEHDDLLKNKEDEQLTDDTKLAAWQNYEVEETRVVAASAPTSLEDEVAEKVFLCLKESIPEICVATTSVLALQNEGRVAKRAPVCLKEPVPEICAATTSVSALQNKVEERAPPCSNELPPETYGATASVGALDLTVLREKESNEMTNNCGDHAYACVSSDDSHSEIANGNETVVPEKDDQILLSAKNFIDDDHAYARSSSDSEESNAEINNGERTPVVDADEVINLADLFTFGEFSSDDDRPASNEVPESKLACSSINESPSLIDVRQQCRWW